MIKFIFPFLLLAIFTKAEPQKCCPGPNILIGKTCSDGSNVTFSQCKKYIVEDENFEINSDDALIVESSVIEKTDYCFTELKVTKSKIYIVCFIDIDEPFPLNTILGFISVFFIILTIGVYISVPSLMDLQGICTVHSITGLALSFTILGTLNVIKNVTDSLCHILALFLYVSFVYAFFWLSILSFHIWRTTLKPNLSRLTNKWKLWYHLIGTIGPIILLVVLLVANYSKLSSFESIHPGIGLSSCWFDSLSTAFVYFYGPISVLLVFNIFCYVWTTVYLCKEYEASDISEIKRKKFKLLLCIKLFVVMGITWAFEILSAAFPGNLMIFWKITDCINGLQGVFIFLILVVFRKRVLRALASKEVCSKRLPASWKTLKDDECEEFEEAFILSSADSKN